MYTQADFKVYKEQIRSFLQTAYADDERLAMLLAHAQSGKLSYNSCCCLIGIVTADHRLESQNKQYENGHSHYLAALTLSGAREAQNAYCALGAPYQVSGLHRNEHADARRRRILAPMIRAEFRRRDRLKALFIDRLRAESI